LDELDKATLLEQLRATKAELDLRSRNLELLQERIQELELDQEHARLVSALGEETISRFSYKMMAQNDGMTRYYTGLKNWNTFQQLLDIIESCGLAPSKTVHTKLVWQEKVFLTYVKLRQNYGFEHLAYLFGLKVEYVSKIFGKWLQHIAHMLRVLYPWQSKEQTQRTMHSVFKEQYPDLRVIIDCTEIFLQTPSQKLLQKLTWSDYKSHNTIKYLIGIAPDLKVSLVTRGYMGRISDVELCDVSKFFDLLERGDTVMVDKGFPLKERLDAHGCSLAIPPFLEGKDRQLAREDVTATKRIANIRIHVERAICRIKTFKIITTGNFPLNMVDKLDDIVAVCAYSTGLQPSIIAAR